MKIIKKFTFAALAALAALAATLLFQTSNTQADDHGRRGDDHGQRGDDNKRGDRDQPIPVAIYDTFKRDLITPTPGFGSTWRGVVTVIIGPDVFNGTSRMDVNVTAGIAHCVFTWVIPGEGTIVTKYSVCKLAEDGIGAWSIEKGTGRFKHFKAVGTETFGGISPPTAEGFDNFERFAGIGTFDEHGDD